MSDDLSIPIHLPLDRGFLRRECPGCDRQFKWHNGPTEHRPRNAVDPDVYFCPYCGATAPPGSWWTREQLAYARESAVGPVTEAMSDALENAIGPQRSDSFIKIELQRPRVPEPPPALDEPGDMVAVESPCHPWEPIKVDTSWKEALHCLICGQRFAVQ
jgi:hypothetical protein